MSRGNPDVVEVPKDPSFVDVVTYQKDNADMSQEVRFKESVVIHSITIKKYTAGTMTAKRSNQDSSTPKIIGALSLSGTSSEADFVGPLVFSPKSAVHFETLGAGAGDQEAEIVFSRFVP